MTDIGEEKRRLAFVTARDGHKAAKEWAKTTMRVYRKAVLANGKHGRKFHFASSPNFKEAFIQSYLVLKECALREEECHE